MPKLVRKNVFVEPRALKRAQVILGTRGESEAIRMALEIVAFRDEALKGFDRVAGKAPDYGDPLGRRVSVRVVVDTSVYVAVLRDASFATAFRPRYERALPRTHLSSVVVQELLAGARTPTHRRLAQALIEPFERARRIVTPTHAIWRDAGAVLSELWRDGASYRSAIHGGLVNDVLIALTARAIGATVVTRNRRHFETMRAVRAFGLEVV